MIRSRHGLFVGSFFGIRIYLHYSWFLIAAIVTYTLATKYFPMFLPEQSAGIFLLMGFGAAWLFFLSILLHELGHSLVSQRCGIPVPRITLLFIGGVAEISREPDDARSELKIAVAGPAVSAVLALFYEGLSQLLDRLDFTAGAMIFAWLSAVNVYLIIFNAIPGYPLDGGRVLRALIWARTKNLRRATYITTRLGVGLSWVLMALGVFALLNREWNAVVLFVIGIFLKTAAENGYQQAVYHEVLGDVRVRDLMSSHPHCIPVTMPISLAVEEFFLAHHHSAFPVCDAEGIFHGLLHLDQLRKLPRAQWPFTTAGDLAAILPGSEPSVPEDETVVRAMRHLALASHERLVVLAGDRVSGMITRDDVSSFIKIRIALEP